jgi:hypothetical protein
MQSPKPKIILSIFTLLAGILSWVAPAYGNSLARLVCGDPEWSINFWTPFSGTYYARSFPYIGCSSPLHHWIGRNLPPLFALTAILGAIIFLRTREGMPKRYTILSLLGLALGLGFFLLYVFIIALFMVFGID